MIKVLLALLCSICLLACKEKQSIEWVMTTPDASWQMVEDVEVAGDNSAMIDVEIDAIVSSMVTPLLSCCIIAYFKKKYRISCINFLVQ